jgi:hypothetical protein
MKPRRFIPRGLLRAQARPAETAWPERFLRILKALSEEPLARARRGAPHKLKPAPG